MAESIFKGGSIKFDGLKLSDTFCVLHDVPFLAFGERMACPVCQNEKLNEKEEEYRKSMTLKHQKRITYDRLKKDSLISDPTIKRAAFHTFEPTGQESARNYEKAREITGRYLKGEVFNTVLTGSAGAGKSHLAKSIAEAVNDNSDPWRSVLFLSIDEWLLWIRSTYSDNNLTTEDEKSILDKTAANDLLVLDDLGAETGFIGTKKTASDFTQRMLYGLLNRRQDKSTIITTNLNSTQISNMYDQKIISRMYRGVDESSLIIFKETKDNRIKF